jgi:two-component system response regulator YesN
VYKVFLVEDEIVVREGIRNNIPWEDTGYVLSGEAPDGEMALSILKDVKPDILITDIKMPFMDGLALSRIVKKTMPWIKIIILSGHDEFKFAQEAISIGVEEYLLKPVSAKDMIAALNKIAGRINEETENLRSIEHLRRQVQSHSDVLRDRWLLDVVSGRVPAAEAIERARDFNIDLIASSYITAIIGIIPGVTGTDGGGVPAGGRDISQLLRLKLIIGSITEKYDNVILFQRDEKSLALLVKGTEAPPFPQNGESAAGGAVQEMSENIKEAVYTIAQAALHEAERNLGCRAVVAIGSVADRLGKLHDSYNKASLIALRQSAGSLPGVAGYDETVGEGNSDDTGLLDIDSDMFLAKFRYAAKKDLDGIIGELTGILQDSRDENRILEYFILGELIVAASKVIEDLGGETKKIIPFSLTPPGLHEIVASRDIFYEKIRALFAAVIEFRNSRTRGRYQSVIVKAKEYIARNFREQDISLHTVASHVGISPNHFSAVFSQETGENFVEYLTRVRIEKAKQLLENTAMKSADIAYETGFSDPHYFSFIFKKNAGLSPREYRLKQQK